MVTSITQHTQQQDLQLNSSGITVPESNPTSITINAASLQHFSNSFVVGNFLDIRRYKIQCGLWLSVERTWTHACRGIASKNAFTISRFVFELTTQFLDEDYFT
jgi:hypothetical protein